MHSKVSAVVAKPDKISFLGQNLRTSFEEKRFDTSQKLLQVMKHFQQGLLLIIMFPFAFFLEIVHFILRIQTEQSATWSVNPIQHRWTLWECTTDSTDTRDTECKLAVLCCRVASWLSVWGVPLHEHYNPSPKGDFQMIPCFWKASLQRLGKEYSL